MSGAKPCVSFSTSAKVSSGWPEGFEHVSDDEIEALRCDCQWALWSLDVECSRRSEKKTEAVSNSEFAKTIEENATKVHKNKALDLGQIKNLSKSRTYLLDLNSGLTNSGRKQQQRCKELCWQVLRWTNMDLALLLVASFGRLTLNSFRQQQAVQAVEYIYQHKEDLDRRVCGLLGVKAIAGGVHESKPSALRSIVGGNPYACHHNVDEVKKDVHGSLTEANTTESINLDLLPKTHMIDTQHEGGATPTWHQESRGASDDRMIWPYQQYSASRTNSSQQTMYTSPPLSYNYSNLNGYDVSNTNDITVNTSACEEFKHLDQGSFSRPRPTQAARESNLSPCLLDGGQRRASLKDRATTPTEELEDEAPGPYPQAEFTNDPVEYYPTFPDAGGIFTAEALEMQSDWKADAIVSYFPTYGDTDVRFSNEASDVEFLPGTVGTVGNIPYAISS